MLSTLIEIRKFLESNIREVITIIFEDYLKNPTILKTVFDQAGISPYVLLKDNWGDGFTDWPTLNAMRRLGRLVVFNNNGLHGFPYTEVNMWSYVRENRYGSPGRNERVCARSRERFIKLNIHFPCTRAKSNLVPRTFYPQLREKAIGVRLSKLCIRVKWPTCRSLSRFQ